MEITKVLIPAAGYGTRWLPFTKTIPKEMAPLLNKPALQLIVEECVQGGLTDCCIIVNEDKKAIKDYFSPDQKLEKALKQVGKADFLDGINGLISQTDFHYFDQPEMKGLAHALQMARSYINNEYFGVALPDMFFLQEESAIGQMIAIARKYRCTVISIEEVPEDQIHAYGAVKIRQKINDDLVELDDIVEKPKNAQEAPSLFAITGRYVFPPAIFDAIDAIAPQVQGEIQLTDAITHLAHNGHKVLAYRFKSKCFDTGRPPGWLAANLFLGLNSEQYGAQVQAILKEYCS